MDDETRARLQAFFGTQGERLNGRIMIQSIVLGIMALISLLAYLFPQLFDSIIEMLRGR